MSKPAVLSSLCESDRDKLRGSYFRSTEFEGGLWSVTRDVRCGGFRGEGLSLSCCLRHSMMSVCRSPKWLTGIGAYPRARVSKPLEHKMSWQLRILSTQVFSQLLDWEAAAISLIIPRTTSDRNGNSSLLKSLTKPSAVVLRPTPCF